MSDIDKKRDELLRRLADLPGCVVAFSGGVDSSVVAKAAAISLGDRAIAVTAVSPSLASSERETARDVARQIGIRHVEIATQEMENPAYVANGPDRCFHCKTALYATIESQLKQWDLAVIVNGANADDRGDHRPGMRAAAQHRVLSPLAACGLGKDDVRQLASRWGLSVARKPATPCLSSRIAYGVEVTAERLQMIEDSETWLRSRGLHDVRVRYHPNELARVEVDLDQLAAVCAEPFRSQMTRRLTELGFKFVTVDLQGRRTGSLNRVIPIEQIERLA